MGPIYSTSPVFAVVLLLSAHCLFMAAAVSSPPQNEIKSEADKKNILFLLPLSSKSHKHVFEPLIRALAEKGHEITVIAATKSSNMPSNVREIVVVKDEEIFDSWDDPIENRKKGKFGNMFMDISFALRVCEKVYDSEKIQTLLKTHKGKFDLAFVDLILNQCFYGMLTHFEMPFISISTLPPWSGAARLLGTNLPSSFIPIPFMNFPEKMNFLSRVHNNLLNWITPFILRYYYNQPFEKVYQARFGEHYPTAEEIEANASMMFTNSHFSLNPKMPLLPDIVEVGGMHLKPPKPLANDLEAFLKDAKDGFIYFSLGSIVRAKSMPEKTRKTFLRVFSKLKQKVLWKWEVDMPDAPPNVKVSKWLPQQDLLGHPNIRLFITHGGLLSLQEAVYHGVPVLGIPVFGDQDTNCAKAVDSGWGLLQEILEINEEELSSKLNQLLTENKFRNRVKDLAKIIGDQPQSSLERAVFWSEYVMRHKGAPFLRSPARELNFFQYFSLDVVAFVIGSILLMAWLLIAVCKWCCGSNRKSPMQKYDGKKKLH